MIVSLEAISFRANSKMRYSSDVTIATLPGFAKVADYSQHKMLNSMNSVSDSSKGLVMVMKNVEVFSY